VAAVGIYCLGARVPGRGRHVVGGRDAASNSAGQRGNHPRVPAQNRGAQQGHGRARSHAVRASTDAAGEPIRSTHMRTTHKQRMDRGRREANRAG
jgi:hypothetical protein